MKVQKWELANKIKKLRAVVPKQAAVPILQNILVKDGRMVATNLELTVSTAVEGAEGETMLIPAKAFGLIDQLPNGEMEITGRSKGERNAIMIRQGTTKTVFETLDPQGFPQGKQYSDVGGEACIDGGSLARAIRNVLYAVSKTSDNQAMCAVCMECGGGRLSVVGLNANQIAWDSLPYDGEFRLLIPRGAAEQLVGLGIEGDVHVSFSDVAASFRSEEYTVETRLVGGNFIQYQKAFRSGGECIEVCREPLVRAVRRADACNEDVHPVPVRVDLDGDSLRVYINSSNAAYSETMELDRAAQSRMTIAFNPALLRATLESFPDEKVQVLLASPKMPMIVRSKVHGMQAMILPVMVST